MSTDRSNRGWKISKTCLNIQAKQKKPYSYSHRNKTHNPCLPCGCVLILSNIIRPFQHTSSKCQLSFLQFCSSVSSTACQGLLPKPAVLTHIKVLHIQALCQGLEEQILCSHKETHIETCSFRFSHIPSLLKWTVDSWQRDTDMQRKYQQHPTGLKTPATESDIKNRECFKR